MQAHKRRALLGLVGMVLLLVGAGSMQRVRASDDPPEEYNFRWLDTDKKIYVLQNRKFVKANRLLVTAMAGPTLSTPYRGTISIHPRVAYYFAEWIGLEVMMSYNLNWENSTFTALTEAVPGALPVTRQLQLQYGALLHYVPWYAKINVFNNILYFDWYFSAGAGASQVQRDIRANRDAPASYASETFATAFLGTGHQYHLNKYFTVRLDFTASLYPAPAQGASGDLLLNPNYTFLIGAGVRL